MKKIIPLLLILINSTVLNAQELTAFSVEEVLQEISNVEFKYKERGKLFNYFSTQSCLYAANDIVVFRNYCYPKREYPAQGFTIISKKVGMIDVYEEQLAE